ncbi:hypothetical protein HY478_03610 [Candidatus Uhrbacteria bacterium]|nr:hypothetical protein [Candidatus Uhrbacteria bacterium]
MEKRFETRAGQYPLAFETAARDALVAIGLVRPAADAIAYAMATRRCGWEAAETHEVIVTVEKTTVMIHGPKGRVDWTHSLR